MRSRVAIYKAPKQQQKGSSVKAQQGSAFQELAGVDEQGRPIAAGGVDGGRGGEMGGGGGGGGWLFSTLSKYI